MRARARTRALPGVGTGWPWCSRPLVLAGGCAGLGPTSPAVRAGNSRAKWIADAVRGDAGLFSRPTLIVTSSTTPGTPISGWFRIPNWCKTQGLYGLGMKTPDTHERLSLLLRHARPGHDRLVESPLVAAGSLLPGVGAAVAAGRDVLQLWFLRADLRPRPDRTRTGPLSVSRSISTGCTAAERTIVSNDERRTLLGGLRHERLHPRDHFFRLGRQPVEDHRVGPKLQCAGLDETRRAGRWHSAGKAGVPTVPTD